MANRGRPRIGLQSEASTGKQIVFKIEARDWVLLDRHATRAGKTLTALFREQIAPLLEELRSAEA